MNKNLWITGLGCVALCAAQAALATPDTIADLRARAHKEIGVRDASIALLQKKLSVDEKELTALQQQIAILQAKALTSSSDGADHTAIVPAPLPFGDQPIRSLSPLQQDTLNALAAHQVIFTADVTDVFNRTADVNLAVTNQSAHPIQFMTNPTMFYGNGFSSELKVIRVNSVPFPAPQSQVEDAFAQALAGPGRGTYTGTIALPGYPLTFQNAIIPPGGTLYARATGPLFGIDHIPTKFTFRGGGWDNTVVFLSL